LMWLISAGVVPACGPFLVSQKVSETEMLKTRNWTRGWPSSFYEGLNLSTGYPFENDLHLLYIYRRNIKWMIYSKFSDGPFGSSQISYWEVCVYACVPVVLNGGSYRKFSRDDPNSFFILLYCADNVLAGNVLMARYKKAKNRRRGTPSFFNEGRPLRLFRCPRYQPSHTIYPYKKLLKFDVPANLYEYI
jgi:hypothetical protein